MKPPTIKRFFCFCWLALGMIINIVVFNLVYKAIKLARLKRGRVEKFMKFWCYHALVSYMGLVFTRPFFLVNRTHSIRHQRNISIFNHCSEYDWVFIMVIYYNLEMYNELFILMKEELRRVPLLGYVLFQNNHFFVEREKRHENIERLKRSVARLQGSDAYTVFLFPEGTYPHAQSHQSGLVYSRRSQLEVNNEPFLPKNVLIPKKGGFNAIQSHLDAKFIVDGTFFNNPYHFMLQSEQTHLQYLISEKIPISPIIVLNEIRNENITEDFVYKSFYTKEKMIERYKERLSGLSGGILTQEEAKAVMIDVLGDENIKVLPIRVRSKYRHVVFLATVLIALGTGYFAYKGVSIIINDLLSRFLQ